MSTQKSIIKIQDWYISNCDGDWEHACRFKLESLDNPGWMLTVDLAGTHQENQAFTERRANYEHDTQWIFVRKEGAKLKGACGPTKLEEMLTIVAEWLQPIE